MKWMDIFRICGAIIGQYLGLLAWSLAAGERIDPEPGSILVVALGYTIICAIREERAR